MIKCSICDAENDDFATVCFSCKSYVQSKIDNLNLFETVWKLIELPREGFRRIVLSHHKNYVFLLSCLFGTALAYTVFWYKDLGPVFSNLLTLVGSGILLGPPLGIMFVLVASVVLRWTAHLFGGKAGLKNTYALVAYACVPIVISLVFVFPVEIAIFGQDFFGKNPPPLVINPVIYIVLIAFDVLAVAWSWFLLVEGTIVANGFTRGKTVLVSLSVLLLTVAVASLLYFV
ncbi:MAG: hypothetical protein HW412_732 [Bacteroidetes bacterium]|nr:hypothetical protein [Bacteroidota bacterium]